jgi:hypothetical protein
MRADVGNAGSLLVILGLIFIATAFLFLVLQIASPVLMPDMDCRWLSRISLCLPFTVFGTFSLVVGKIFLTSRRDGA